MPIPRKAHYRFFPASVKFAAVKRLEAGERLAAVADDVGIARTLLCEWRAAWRAEGMAWLERKRGPKPDLRQRRLAAGVKVASASAKAEQVQAEALTTALARIGELERIIGRQQAGLDFFQRALQALDASETPSSCAPGSTPSSKP